ncbi:adhesion G-protein coupled receptor G5 [Labeo rohita]|uniref:adhesion G-protein coupled receptor G5 n=1 Tax=Labeo rohita TaxID=84645 RepID=UPI0021E1C23C|nr:adhesion G-protein coupled receptor G5 [Labeo rohita]XP_050994528.1 adhesion G-protein coupled receptor G5 [Labeo rohita]XP_050994529.1 adhesion G-protein coupled receptor G5 [Labeo rohita]
MLLRNLEILSGMKWNICGLVLILSALSCMFAENNNKMSCVRKQSNQPCSIPGRTSDCKNNEDVDMFILGADCFMGYLKTGKCNNNNNKTWSEPQCPSATLCQSVQSQFDLTVFSFEGNRTCTVNNTCTKSSDYGVNLSGDIQTQTYRLSISRFVIPKFVCVIKGRCRNNTLTDWINKDCYWTNNVTHHFKNTNCSMTCLNPTKTCQNAEYDYSCSDDNADDESKMNNIEIHNEIATCYKCGSAFQNVKAITLPKEMSSQFNTNETETDAGAAAETMKSLSSLLSFMENKTVASVSMGNVKGILKKIQNDSKITTSYFIYSSSTGIRVLEDVDEIDKYPNAFSIPEEAAKKALNQSARSAFLGVFRFPNMTKDAENSTVLNDEVYAIEMGGKISNLSNGISLTFKKDQQATGTPVCKSWNGNGNQPNWTTEGCSTFNDGKGKIKCNCTHLTFFAVLMIPPNVTISQNDFTALTYITYIGCGLSMFFLSIGLFMHFLMRKVKVTESMHILINLFVALFLLNVAFLSNEYVARTKEVIACRVMAGVMHYFLLASFTWFAVEAFHLCLQMAKHAITIKHYLIKISVVGWAPPAIVVSVIYVLKKYGEQTITMETSNVTMCWIVDSEVHYFVNIGYYCFTFIFTFITFIVVMRWLSMLKMSRLSMLGKVKRSGIATSDITSILGLCCMLGLTWSFAFFSYGALRLPSYYIFTILNSLQGFFLFIYYLKTSRLIGDSAPSDTSDTTEDVTTENPYEDLPSDDNKKAI